STKVALYVADCRRMGIQVEPPDINCSGWDFTIEDHDSGSSTIRFGLGAVKNVGHGPVDVVLEGRESGAFEDLNDFAHRVDLRHVGKRALESLIRVGALDTFGSRQSLLDGIDRIISVSAAHFRAKEMGQMSLFGAHTGVVESIVLPNATSAISRREMLNWERELIGLYVSDHPLSPVMNELSEAVTHFSAQLSEAAANEHVRVAGMITRIRNHQTKTGKAMGFVTIEDIQGSIELVVFPRTWARLSEVIGYDKIVLVEGKLDAQGGEPKVLVDSITTDITMLVPHSGSSSGRPIPEQVPEAMEDEDLSVDEGMVDQDQDASDTSSLSPFPNQDDLEDGDPPPPDLFPADWGQPVSSEPGEVVSGEQTPQTVTAEPLRLEQTVAVQEPEPAKRLAPQIPAGDDIDELVTNSQNYLVSPVQSGEGAAVHMITVILRSTGDKTRDVLRMRRIHGTAMSFPGNDRFAFHVFERGHGYLVEFPNFTTGLCPDLLSKLRLLAGSENVRVEPITFQ
ncbi:MAG: helix-hairpin-helix domain-containing protein, partial [Anaerolineales bacterium]